MWGNNLINNKVERISIIPVFQLSFVRSSVWAKTILNVMYKDKKNRKKISDISIVCESLHKRKNVTGIYLVLVKERIVQRSILKIQNLT